MSIRRKSTTHDLATLRLHPDGSRVQQSSVNTRRRRAGITVVDSRGNWIAKDAGGKSSVKKRRSISSAHAEDNDGEFIDLSSDDASTPSQTKGKQRARDDDRGPLQKPGLSTRSRKRLSFMHDLSFLDPPPDCVSSLDQDTSHSSATEPGISFTDPAPDLLKSIHHFTSCYYRERGQLFDSGRNYRGIRRERKQSKSNIHTLAANASKHQGIDSESKHAETEDEAVDESDNDGERAVIDTSDDEREEPEAKINAYKKDMYKAFDGSALMAIGIVLQEYVAHTLQSRSHSSEAPQGQTDDNRVRK